jgi:subtilisin family serine protease/subtilisin-like proprotein convertase family protein
VGFAADQKASFTAPSQQALPQLNGRPVSPKRLLAKLVSEDKLHALDTVSGNPAIARAAKMVAAVVPFPNIKSLVTIELNDEGSLLPTNKDGTAGKSAADPVKQSLLIKQRIKEFTDTGLYEYVEPDYIYHASATPTDAAFTDGRLWGLRNTGQSGGVSGADIEAVAAWDQTTGASNVIVAIIDTGVRYTHQDLVANIWTNPNEIAGNNIDDDHNGYVDDVHGINAITNSGNPMDDNSHGTHCAGTIGGIANNSGATVGVAWNVKIMGLKFLDSSGSGATSNAIKCIDYAISKGVRIMSNSWGGGGYSQALYDAVERAKTAGSLFVVAAGNESANNDSNPSYPASYTNSNIIAVAALDRGDLMASFSNYGATSVDLGAPGVSIFSSVSTSDSAYATYNGTSMATPHVSGVAALVLAKYPSISLTDFRNRIVNNTRPVASLNGKVATGGAVSANRALGASAVGGMSVNVSTRPSPLHAGQQGALLATITKSGTALTSAAVTGTFQSRNVAFLDNGVSPDDVSNDGIYSANVTAPGSAGSYPLSLSATHPSSTTFSGSFSIPVASPGPANDNFAAAEIISQQATQLNGTNVGATAETGEPAHVGTTAASVSVWWKWTPAQSMSATVTTIGSNFDTYLAVYTGSQLGNLVRVASNDDSGGGLQSSVTFNATGGTSYFIAVDGYRGATGNIVLHVPAGGTLPSSPPVFTKNPVNQTVLEGQSATFTVNVTGSPNPTLYWRQGGQVLADGGRITGSSTATLTIAGVVPTDSDSYDCVAVNTAGSGTSAAAFLTVDSANTLPANDNFANRIPNFSNSAATGSNDRATKETNEPNHAGVSGGHSVWWTWTADVSGQVDIDTYGSTYDTTLAVYRGSALNSLVEVASNDDSDGVRQSKVSFTATAGTAYQIAVDGNGQATGNVRLLVTTAGAGGIFPSPNVPLPVLDNKTITSVTTVSGLATSVAPSSLMFDLNVTHPYRGDLVVTLTSPEGYVFTISNRAGGSADDLVITDVALSTFSSNAPGTINPNGTWTLSVRDAATTDEGTLNSWGLRSTMQTYTLAVNAGTGGTVTKQPNNMSYSAGAVVTVTAIPSGGYQFSNWSGGATGTQNPLQVTVNGNTIITASFSPMSQTVATPIISPNGGPFTKKVTVALSTATAGALIYYTDNGTEPTTRSKKYKKPFNVSKTRTIKVMAFKSGMTQSSTATAVFTKQ